MLNITLVTNSNIVTNTYIHGVNRWYIPARNITIETTCFIERWLTVIKYKMYVSIGKKLTVLNIIEIVDNNMWYYNKKYCNK